MVGYASLQAINPHCIGIARKKVDSYLRGGVCAMGGDLIPHPDIAYDLTTLFMGNGAQPLSAGADLFLRDLQSGLLSVWLCGAVGIKR